MNVAIVGSRDFSRLHLVEQFVLGLASDSVIVSGGAHGVDAVAEETARSRGLEVIIFKADWDKYGKSAGFIRNKSIVDHSDIIVAFWDGESKGTHSTIKLAKKFGKTLLIMRR